MMAMEEWDILQQLQEQGLFSPLDLYYARRASHYAGLLSLGQASLLAATMAAARHGHLCLNRRDITSLFPKEHSCSNQLYQFLESAFASWKEVNEKLPCFLHIKDDLCYLPKNFSLEKELLHELSRLGARRAHQVLVPDFPLSKSLSEEQASAVATALQYSLTLLTGGPGTGKTFTAAAIVQAFLCSPKTPTPKVFLAAPTARAADHLKNSLLDQAMDERCLSYAGTLHGLLRHKNHSYSMQVPWLDADLIIVDESSMMDAALFVTLLTALPEKSTIVLMGDPHQLHPVGIGSLFFDLVHAELPFPLGRAHLEHCIRVEDRPLLELAACLKNNQSCNWPFFHTSFEIHEREEIYDKLWELTMGFWPKPTSQIPDHNLLLESLKSFRILSVLRQGIFGTETLSAMLMRRLYTQASLNDWVMAPIQITRNDRATGLRNGELGILLQPKREASPKGYALFTNRDHPLPLFLLPPYEYAFCSSVHKSQGSEYDEVLLIVPPGSEAFGREMLYTGVTRAKKKLRVISTPKILADMQRREMRKSSGLASGNKFGKWS